MREHLLGYLMGALDASQQSEVERALENDPLLRQELELLDQALTPLRADSGLYEPPLGLADRTLDAVAAVAGWPDEREHGAASDSHLADGPDFGGDLDFLDDAADRDEAEAFAQAFHRDLPKPELFSHAPMPAYRRGDARMHPVGSGERPSRIGRGAVWDLAVTAGVVAAAAILFFPAIANSRFQARVAACQNNLQTLARSLEKYSENHNGQFVSLPLDGNLSFAGVYAPTLRDEGYVTGDQVFRCAGDLASRTDDLLVNQPIPTVSELERATGAELRRLQRLAGGSFGYNLGYLVNGRYSAVRNRHRATFAVLADAPGPQYAGRVSLHHEGRGQNVAFEDGHVQFVPTAIAGDFDDIFFSDRGLVEAGLHPEDAVIGNSHSRPLLWPTAGW